MTTEGPVRCGVCGVDILANWIRMRMTEPRIEVNWQLVSGFCVTCHRARLAAAHDYEMAAAEVRLWELLGAVPSGRGKPPPGHSALAAAMRRVAEAEEKCIRLKIWPAERGTRRPPWFYGDERSNTA